MPRFRLSMHALLIVALAGCLETSVDDAEEVATTAHSGPLFRDGRAAPTHDVLADCQEAVGSFPVPATEYWDRTPPGFNVAAYSAVGSVPPVTESRDTMGATVSLSEPTPPDPTAFTAELVAVASTCHDASDDVVNRLLVFLMVDPPRDLHNDAAAFGHGLLFAYFTDSEAHANLLEAWGFGPVLHVGPMTAELTTDPAMRSSETAGAVASSTARLDTSVAGPPTAMDGSAARFFAADADGKLVGVADASFGSFDAMAGRSSLAGSADTGIWQSGADLSGLGLQVWGHSNEWAYVNPLQPEDA